MKNYNVKVSCLPVSLYPQFFSGLLDIPAWSAMAADMGLDAIDINAMFFENRTYTQIATLRKALKLPVLMVSTYTDFTNTDAQIREHAVKTASRFIESANAIGATYVRLTAGQYYTGTDEVHVIDSVFECFEKCIPIAENNGITILLENHSKPTSWQYPDFNFCMDRFFRLWESLRVLPISINFDTANAFALGNWQTLFDMVSDRIRTVHINDLSNITPLTFCCVGEGIVPIKDMMSALIKNRYEGPLCIEEASFRGTEGIRCAVKNTKTLWANAVASILCL